MHDDGVEVTADNIKAITKAAGVEVEGYWPGLFAKLLEKKSLDDFITNVGAAGAAPAAGGGGGAAAAGGDAGGAAPAEEKEEEEESEEDMGFSLFD